MRFVCSECEKVCAIDEDSLGQPVVCGHCQEVTVVPPSILAPRVIIGDFRIDEEIGQGGMGTVFLAHQISLDRTVALKILNDEYAANSAFIVDFVNEARAAARLNHPNIVQAYAVDEESGYYFFAMEYIEGQTLKEVLDEQGPLPPEQALRIMQQIAEALDFAWTQSQLVHRDIKPDNIMITTRGIAKLADLGLARGAKELMGDVDDEVMGTPQYICPEQLTGQPMDVRGDLYSLGGTIFHALTGQFPFDGDSPAEIARKHLQEPVPDPCAVSPDIAPEVGFIIRKTMAKRLEDRYDDAAALGEDLQRVLAGGEPIGYEPPPPREDGPLRVTPVKASPKAVVRARMDDDLEDDDFEDTEEIATVVEAADDADKSGTGRRRMSIKKRGRKMSLRTGAGSSTSALSAVPPPGAKKRRKLSRRAKILIAGGVFVLAVAVVVLGALIWGLLWLQDQAPASREEALTMYLAVAGPEEREEWAAISELASKEQLSQAELFALLGRAQRFREDFPNSLFVRPAEEIGDYAELYDRPALFNDNIRMHARHWAGYVNQLVGRHEEELIRILRAERHQENFGEALTERLRTVVREQAAAAVAKAMEDRLKQRKQELSRAVQQTRNDLAHNREVVQQERAEVRPEIFRHTADYEWPEARDRIRDRRRKMPDLRGGIGLRIDALLEQTERERAEADLNEIARNQRRMLDAEKLLGGSTDPELKARLDELLESDQQLLTRIDIEEAFDDALADQGIEDLREQLAKLKDEEEAVAGERRAWFDNHEKALGGAMEFFELVANTGEHFDGRPVDLPLLASGSSAEIAYIQSRHASVRVTYYPGGQRATRVERIFLQDLGFKNIVKLAREKWAEQHVGTKEFEIIEALFLGYSLESVEAARKLIAAAEEDPRTAFLLTELDHVGEIEEEAKAQRDRRRKVLVMLRRFYHIRAEDKQKGTGRATAFYEQFAAQQEQYGDVPMYTRALEDMRRELGIEQ